MIDNMIAQQDRYLKPLISLIDNLDIKLLITSLSGIGIMVLETLGVVLDTNVNYIVALAFLITVDFITGVWSAYRRGERITSIGFRSTFVKTIEYMFILTSVTVLSNMTPVLEFIEAWAYIFVCTTELKSIGENVPRINSFFTQLFAMIKEKTNVDVTK